MCVRITLNPAKDKFLQTLTGRQIKFSILNRKFVEEEDMNSCSAAILSVFVSWWVAIKLTQKLSVVCLPGIPHWRSHSTAATKSRPCLSNHRPWSLRSFLHLHRFEILHGPMGPALPAGLRPVTSSPARGRKPPICLWCWATGSPGPTTRWPPVSAQTEEEDDDDG